MSMPEIDLLLWPGTANGAAPWPHGQTLLLPRETAELSLAIARWAESGTAEFGLLWGTDAPLPAPEALLRVVRAGVDLGHCGLARGMDRLLPDLGMVKLDWSMLSAPADRVSTSWRVGLDACLVRRDLLRRAGEIDPAFASPAAAGLDLGLRVLNRGGVVEHRPELCTGAGGSSPSAAPDEDLYTFLMVLRPARPPGAGAAPVLHQPVPPAAAQGGRHGAGAPAGARGVRRRRDPAPPEVDAIPARVHWASALEEGV
jgi:hypothetical protein